ncbi:MAG: protoporphyrinogen oxidase [Candidatus Binatia bacterium]
MEGQAPKLPSVVVVGAGISGLSTAWNLTNGGEDPDRSVDVTVLEAGDRAGGVIATARRGGFICELGPDSMITEKPWGLDLCDAIGVGGNIIGTGEQHRRSFIARGQRIYPVPEGFNLLAPTRFLPFVTTSLFSPAGKLRMAADLILPRRREPGDESLADFVRRRLGQQALERIAQPMVGGIYTADPEKLSLLATMPRFREMEARSRSVILAMLRSRRAMERRSPSLDAGPRYGMFATLRGGLQELPQTIEQSLPRGCVHYKQRVRSVTHRGDHWIVRTDSGELRADGLCLALPAPAAAAVLRAVSPELSTELGSIEYASTATLNLMYRREDIHHALDGFGFVVPAIERRSILACTFSSVKFPGRAPAGNVLLRAFVGGALFPEKFALDDASLLESVRADLDKLLDIRHPPREAIISRHADAMAQYHVGHLDRISRIDSLVTDLPGLALAGNAYGGIGIPDCIHSGETAARSIIAQLLADAPPS